MERLHTASSMLAKLHVKSVGTEESFAALLCVHEQLTMLQDALEDSELTENPHAVDLFGYLVGDFKDMVDAYSRSNVITRYIGFSQTKEDLMELASDLAALSRRLKLVTETDWHLKMEQEIDTQEQTLEKRVKEIRHPRAQIEAMALLRHEFQQHAAGGGLRSQTKTTIDAMHRLYDSLAASGFPEPTLPEWFLSPQDLDIAPASWATVLPGSTLTGKYGIRGPVTVQVLVPETVQEDEDEFLQEMEMWYSLRHPHVVRLFGGCHVSPQPFLVCAHTSHGDLASYLASSRAKHSRTWRLLSQAALGLDYLHSRGIVHGNLTLTNILVGSDGMARITNVTLRKTLGITKPASLSGKGCWRAPECSNGRRPTFTSDIYSLGLCIIEAFTGKLPFVDLADAKATETRRDRKIPVRPGIIPDEAWRLVVSMTEENPIKRVAIGQVIEILEIMATRERDTETSPVCRQCSRVLIPNSKFCSRCGNPVPTLVVELDISSQRKMEMHEAMPAMAKVGHAIVVEPLIPGGELLLDAGADLKHVNRDLDEQRHQTQSPAPSGRPAHEDSASEDGDICLSVDYDAHIEERASQFSMSPRQDSFCADNAMQAAGQAGLSSDDEALGTPRDRNDRGCNDFLPSSRTSGYSSLDSEGPRAQSSSRSHTHRSTRTMIEFPLYKNFFPQVVLNAEEVQDYKCLATERLNELIRIAEDAELAYKWTDIRTPKMGTTIQKTQFLDMRPATKAIVTSTLIKCSVEIRDSRADEVLLAIAQSKTKEYRKMMGHLHGSAFMDGRTLFKFPSSSIATSHPDYSYHAIKWCAFKDEDQGKKLDFCFLEYAGKCKRPPGSNVVGFCLQESIQREREISLLEDFGFERGYLSRSGIIVSEMGPSVVKVTAICQISGDIETSVRSGLEGIVQDMVGSIVRIPALLDRQPVNSMNLNENSLKLFNQEPRSSEAAESTTNSVDGGRNRTGRHSMPVSGVAGDLRGLGLQAASLTPKLGMRTAREDDVDSQSSTVCSSKMSVAFAAPADATSGDVRQLRAEEIAANDAHHYSLEDVLVVAALLAKVPKFPMDMLGEVLALADFLVFFEAVTHEDRHGHDNMNEVYLELNIPAVELPHGVTMPQCMVLVVECSSRDQGWATDATELNHTYNASHTWSEIAVLKPSVSEDADSPAALTEVGRSLFTPNLRAWSEPRHHLKEFKDPRGLLQHVALGGKVQLVLRSQYPGWANHANYGRIRARFALDIGEDAKLPLIDHVAAARPG